MEENNFNFYMNEGSQRGREGGGGGVGMGRTQFIALTSPCGVGIGMQRTGGSACSCSGGCHVVGRRFPPSLLAVLSVVSPVVTPPPWLAVLESPVAAGWEAVLVPVARWLVVAVVPWGLLVLG